VDVTVSPVTYSCDVCHICPGLIFMGKGGEWRFPDLTQKKVVNCGDKKKFEFA
jgi:hypothetical protein